MRAVRRWRPYPVDETCKLYLPFYKYGAEQSKIWDISGNQNHGTISGAVPAIYPMLRPVVASTAVTRANMKISAVAGTAFVDFSAAGVLTGYLDHLLVIKDSSGRTIQGYIKAAGTGETFLDLVGGVDPSLLNGDFSLGDTGWTKQFGWTIVDQGGGDFKGVATAAPDTGLYRLVSSVSSKLYNYSITISSYIAGGIAARLGAVQGPTFSEDGELTGYFTSTATTSNYSNKTVGETTLKIDLVTLREVLTPSATGVTIVSTKGGATFNWEAKGPLFDYNDSSGYTYTIYSVPSYTGSAWFGDGVDDRIVHSSLNLGTTHTLHYWLLYRGLSGVIHGGAANYHGLRLTPTACGYNVGTTEVTVTHSAAYGMPVLFSIDRNGTSVDFYQNGVKIGTTQTLLANTAQVLTDFFRYSDGTSYWNGILFDVVNININKGTQEIRNYFEMTRAKYGQ